MKRLVSGLLMGLLSASFVYADDVVQNVILETNKGVVTIALYPKKAPKTVANFLNYVDKGAYNGVIFHRVIKGFMVQGGGFDRTMTPRPSEPPIVNESNNGLKNDIGTIAMARTQDPHSATNQFFINVVSNRFLNYQSDSRPGYCVFGKVTDGLDVVLDISRVKTGSKGMFQDVPIQPVIIKSIKKI